jgi:DNA-binding NarL/FixJ family response regulator
LDQTANNDNNRLHSTRSSRIVLVEPQTLLRAGLNALLQLDREYEVVGEAESVDAAMQIIEGCSPDLVVTDIELRGQCALPLLAWLERTYPEVGVLVLSDTPAQDKVQAALAAGAEGYILKDATKSELMRSIRSVLSGKEFVSSEVAARALTRLFGRQKRAQPGRARPLLTTRERQILKMIALAETTKSIASQLNLSVKTVEKHRANLMKKLDLKNSAAVTLYAVRHGMVPIDKTRDGSPAP